MTKINQEEYEVLRELDDKWKWIARDEDESLWVFTEKPFRKSGRVSASCWDTETGRSYPVLELIDEIHLFQFIQWEDDEPYSIQGLINEYLDDEYGYFNMKLSREFEEFIKKENEETEVKSIKNVIEFIESDINLIEEKLPKMNREKSEGRKEWHEGYLTAMKEVQNKLGQLEEPEVLSDKWIDDNSVYASSDGVTEEYVHVDDLKESLVPKQELPVVPTWFDEWWKYATKGGGNLFHNMERFYDELFSSGTRETYEYISNPDNKKKLLNIIINELEYEVEEEEQKYIVSDNSSIPLLIKNDSGKIMSYDSQIAYNNSNGTIELTEQEIKNYDPRYMTFAKPVEEME